MSMPATARWLADGRRMHFHHGPIDLIVEAFGAAGEVRRAYTQAWAAFRPVLDGLVAELEWLRRPLGGEPVPLRGPVARRMVAAGTPFVPRFITPMAAVAGAVADHVLAAMVAGRRLTRAYVNNGGDVAIHLAPGAEFTVGVVGRLNSPTIDAAARLTAATPVRGIATSGQGGRSLSLGIADAVTALARTAAEADAAATLIANAVDVASPAVRRAPAHSLVEGSDLGSRLVTTHVGALSDAEIAAALASGVATATAFHAEGRIAAAYLSLRGETRVVGGPTVAEMVVRAA